MKMRFLRFITPLALVLLYSPFVGIQAAWADRPWQDSSAPARFISDHPLSSPVESALTALPDGTLYSLDKHGIPQRIDLVDGQLYPIQGLPMLTTITANDQGIWGVTAGPKFELLTFAPTSGTIINRVSLNSSSHTNSRFSAIQVTNDKAYLADENNPALVAVNLDNSTSRRLLEGIPSLSAHTPLYKSGRIVTTPEGKPRTGGNVQFMVLDHTEKWLFYQTPTGPLYRLATSLLTDNTISPAEQIEGMANWRSTPSLGGLTINHDDTLYMIDINHGDLLAFGTDRIPLRLLHDDRLTQTHSIALLPRSSRAYSRLAILLQEKDASSSTTAAHIAEIGLP